MRKERKSLRFVPQKLRKSVSNGNPIVGWLYGRWQNKLFNFINSGFPIDVEQSHDKQRAEHLSQLYAQPKSDSQLWKIQLY